MTAYVIANIQTLDTSDALAEYRRRVGPTLDKYGGRFAVRGGKIEVIEGDWTPVHLSLIEFDDGEQARAWLSSAEYQAILPLRTTSVKTDLVLVESRVLPVS
jgi:uncharacterized protein (DUF1330 family)